ncbi:MAG TPA: MBL fold metallo-hydrolase [Methylomusa anaerophila]|uniref:Ribonuclease n=1 Tax=Methylomusa anaerophila TaxID=1930071 RepID=A0A348ANP3_9FIRM|nr:MBL fold metallo-hydrolase [Methylomusa anaerophila]BBB92691.1 ribonuclease [Methylomusa anaerophila]HML87456.1 MBL fold metallo-hydrolase [Methylomusa anaerophila]
MRLTFLGATGMVTGSSYLLEVGEGKFLVDCGMFQGSKAITALNSQPFFYDPASINGVLLTHAHIDHSGLLPRLCKSGFKGPIHATKVTVELCGIMLPDSGHIQEFEAEIANRKGQRAGKKPVEPLYTVDDAYSCLKQFSPVAYNTELKLSPEVTVKFQDAGHILGSSMLEIWVTENGKTVKLLFSGDLGQPDQPIIKDPTIIDHADYIIVESTYGAREHDDEDPVEVLAKAINDTVSKGGNIIIPSFAVGRTQTILYYLHELFKDKLIPDIPVIIDSPLAISATDIFMHNTQEYDSEAYDMFYSEHDNPLYLPQLTFTKTSEESKAINKMDRPAIIISASGMADAGRILHHLKHNLWRPQCAVLFVGYQAQGSMGRRLLDGVKKVKIMGEDISVKAKIYNLEGFSAHADRDQLLAWLSNFKTKPANIFIVHGEKDMSEPFAILLQERLEVSTYIPKYTDSALIDGKDFHIEPSHFIMVDPVMQQLRDLLDEMEREFVDYRRRLEEVSVVGSGNSKGQEILRCLKKIRTFAKKTIDDVI